ncbi:DMT family transporter [uncultured Leifsonia sp.]|uniref:DMT family transporter n=1 Tax=uncultured Leifsonia sp. TaxID=340359 RepID=UPI0028D72BFF|nr:DMT family transporter [uncultured Leifsonia sp.]
MTSSTQQQASPSPENAGSRRDTSLLVAVVLTVLVGGLLAFQTRINGALGAALGDGLTAAAIAFGVGLILTAIGLVFNRKGRAALHEIPLLIREKVLAPWMLLGGAVASIFVIAQGLTGALLGTALFTVGAVAGQTVSGLIVDRIGVGPGGSRLITPPRFISAVLCVIAVGFAVAQHIGSQIPVWLVVLPIIGGAATAWQQAVNGRVRAATHSALGATFVNFLTGTVVVVLVAVIHGLAAGFPHSFPTNPLLYMGGVSAVIFIAATTVLVRVTGVLILGLCTVAGQLVTSLILDLTLPQGRGIDLTIAIATVLALIAAVVASVRFRRPRNQA